MSREHATSRKLVEASKSGRLDGLIVLLWVHGGPAPPLYRSDQLVLANLDGRDMLVFAKLRYQAPFAPMSLRDAWRVPARAEDVRAIAVRLSEPILLSTTHDEEKGPGPADGLVYEVRIALGRELFLKRFAGKLPEALGALRSVWEAMIERARTSGEHVVYHDDKIIPDPGEPPDPGSASHP